MKALLATLLVAILLTFSGVAAFAGAEGGDGQAGGGAPGGHHH